MKKIAKKCWPGERQNVLQFCFFILAFYLFILPIGPAEAVGGWHLQFNLVSNDNSTPFQMITSLYISEESNRYYVVEAGRNSLHSYDFEGKYLNTFSPEGVLMQPFDMAREGADGDLWIVEKGRGTLTRIKLKEKDIAPKQLKYKGRRIYPDRLVLHQDKIFVLDKLKGDIISYDKNFNPLKSYESSQTAGGGFMDFVIKGNDIWAFDAKMARVKKFNIDGKPEKEIPLTGYDFSFPVALEIGPAGFIYILDKHRASVVVFDETGAYKYNFLEKGYEKDRLYYPEDIVFDPLGRLCIVDTGNGRVGVFSR